MTANEIFEELLPEIEIRLNEEISEKDTGYSELIEAMRYSLLSGGKRVRPVLLLEFYRLLGGEGDKAYPFALALEMIHTYSLIHDDLPSMDNDDMRRGKPSCHKAYGEATALLAGDALLTTAFSVVAKTKISPDLVVKAIAYLANMAGKDGMVGGQVMDLSLEKTGAAAEELTAMYLKKTSCLLRAAAVCGAALAGADDRKIALAEEYADCVGLAFQIIDDILDCTADEKALGKPIGSDDKNGKTTFVTLYGTEKARQMAAELTEKALSALYRLGGDSERIKTITDYLLNRKY